MTDIVSAAVAILTDFGGFGVRNYRDRLPLAQGRITCELPATVTTKVSDVTMPAGCRHGRRSASLQIDIYLPLDCDPELPADVDAALECHMRQFKQARIEGVKIGRIRRRNGFQDNALGMDGAADAQVVRYIIEYRFDYTITR